MESSHLLSIVFWMFGASWVSFTRAGTVEPQNVAGYTSVTSISVAECGKTKGCMRTPGLCQPSECRQIITWKKMRGQDLVQFELGAKITSDNRWIAVGFSDDMNMPKTSVVDCILQSNMSTVTIQASFNPSYYNKVLSNNQLGLITNDSSSSHVDEFLICKFTKEMEIQSGPESDMVANLSRPYYLFLPEGPVSEQGEKLKHDKAPIISPQKISVLKNSDINISKNAQQITFATVHASLMIISWMLLSSIGILSSRHNKISWKKKIFHKAFWFQVHRGLMTLTALLTVVALVVIFYSKGLNPLQDSHVHPILGLTVASLMAINAIAGVCRPEPGTASRPAFNWVHSIIGNAAHIVAVAAMFYGVQAFNNMATLPGWCQWVVVGFGGWRLLTEIVMTIYKYHKKEDLQVAYVELSGSADHTYIGTREFIFKNVMAIVYVVGVLICTVVVITGILQVIV